MIYASVATSETGLASLRRTYARASRFLPSSRGGMGGGFKLFDTPDVQSALRSAVDAVNGGRPVPQASFPNSQDRGAGHEVSPR